MKKLAPLVLLFAAAACGSTLNGTFGWVPPTNNVAFTGSALGSASAVSIPALESVNVLPPLFQGAANDFAALVLLGGVVTVADPSLAVANINGGFFSDSLPSYAGFASGNRFEFDITSVEWTTSAATNLSLLADGTLIDHLGVFSPTLAAISGSFTTTGAGAVNASFTLTTQTPELGTLALMGLGLGAVAIRRRVAHQ